MPTLFCVANIMTFVPMIIDELKQNKQKYDFFLPIID